MKHQTSSVALVTRHVGPLSLSLVTAFFLSPLVTRHVGPLSPSLLAQTAPRAIVMWDPIQDSRLAGYSVKRVTASTGMTQASPVPIVTTWEDQTIEPTTRYWYGVAGIDTAGQEGITGFSPNLFRFSDIQPASPANLACSQTKTGNRVTINCSWGQVTKTRSLVLLPAGAVVSYRVFLSNTGTVQTFPILGGLRSITISDLKRHQTFYVYLTAVWNGIESLGSPAVRVQT